MHYSLEIVIPPKGEVRILVDTLMSYFRKDEEDYTWFDYYSIGGRYSGKKLRAALGYERIDAFVKLLVEKKFTVSQVVAGKEMIRPESQVPLVDALWREHFPDGGEHCPLFSNHPPSAFDDVCTVANLPPKLKAYRLIAWSKYPGNDFIVPAAMLVEEYWNGIQHQNSDWNGNVKEGIERIMNAKYPKVSISPQDRVVTVDYHN